MVADTVGLAVAIVYFFSGYFFTNSDGLYHGAVCKPASALIVNFARPGLLIEMPEHVYQVSAMNIVPYLFALIPKYGVVIACNRAFHQISQESMKLCARMVRSRKTSPPENTRFHPEIPSVFLYQHISSRFRSAEQGVLGLVYAHQLVNAVFIIRM